jgi:hypothetical protein
LPIQKNQKQGSLGCPAFFVDEVPFRWTEVLSCAGIKGGVKARSAAA